MSANTSRAFKCCATRQVKYASPDRTPANIMPSSTVMHALSSDDGIPNGLDVRTKNRVDRQGLKVICSGGFRLLKVGEDVGTLTRLYLE